MKSVSSFIPFLKRNIIIRGMFNAHVQNYSSQGISNVKKKVDDLFLNSDVQSILKKITGLDYDRIFAKRHTELAPIKYEFATEKRLKELQDEVNSKAMEKLQMPPVMEVREPIDEVMSKDPELQGYLRNNLVFVDTSHDVSSRDRIVAVRELNGTLRKGTWEERDRMIQIFFPIPGRELEAPVLFEGQYLERLLEEGSYKFILDSACIQFEPDHPEYHRVTSTTYEHIEKMKQFDALRSTRHFGPMAFHLAYNKKIDSLLIDMVERHLISDAADTIRLLYILHPELKSASKDITSEVEIIQDYIRNSAKAADLELRLQTFLEMQQQQIQHELQQQQRQHEITA